MLIQVQDADLAGPSSIKQACLSQYGGWCAAPATLNSGQLFSVEANCASRGQHTYMQSHCSGLFRQAGRQLASSLYGLHCVFFMGACFESFLWYCCSCKNLSNFASCRGDLKFIVEQVDKTAIQRLEHVASTPFKRLSYTEAVEILEDAIKNKKKKFEFKVGRLLAETAIALGKLACVGSRQWFFRNFLALQTVSSRSGGGHTGTM